MEVGWCSLELGHLTAVLKSKEIKFGYHMKQSVVFEEEHVNRKQQFTDLVITDIQH